MSVKIDPKRHILTLCGGDILVGYDFIAGHKVLLVQQDQERPYTKVHVAGAVDMCMKFLQDKDYPHPKILIADFPAKPTISLLSDLPKYFEYNSIFSQQGLYLYLVNGEGVTNLARTMMGAIQKRVSLSMKIVDSAAEAYQFAEELIEQWNKTNRPKVEVVSNHRGA